jgi:hypothetical protein
MKKRTLFNQNAKCGRYPNFYWNNKLQGVNVHKVTLNFSTDAKNITDTSTCSESSSDNVLIAGFCKVQGQICFTTEDNTKASLSSNEFWKCINEGNKRRENNKIKWHKTLWNSFTGLLSKE